MVFRKSNSKAFFLVFLLWSVVVNSYAREIYWPEGLEFNSKNIQFIHRGNSNVTIRFSRQTEIGGNPLVVNENISLFFTDQGQLVIGPNEAIHINGIVQAQRKRIFINANTSDDLPEIKFGRLRDFYPEWWGVVPNVKPQSPWNNYENVRQMMLDLRNSNGGHLHFAEGIYFIRDLIIDFSNLTVSGAGNKTILKYDDRLNSLVTTTRQGQIVAVRGPSREGKLMGNWHWAIDEQIENVTIKDISIIYEHRNKKAFDPLLNGLVVMNAKDIKIENVKINLSGGNRGIYIGAWLSNEQTENIIIRRCEIRECLTGIFITHGAKTYGKTRKNRVLSDVLVQECRIYVQRSKVDRSPSGYSSGVYIHGSVNDNEITSNAGKIQIVNNEIQNADIGVRLEFPVTVIIRDNLISAFKFCGISGLFKDCTILGNYFDTHSLQNAGLFNYNNAAINLRANALDGDDRRSNALDVTGNIFHNISSERGGPISHTIFVMPTTSNLITIVDNSFKYEGAANSRSIPLSDIKCWVDGGKRPLSQSTLIHSGNKIHEGQKSLRLSITGRNAAKFSVKSKE
ncbi:hypothetical protein EDD80_1174 [Anseongella ginsenosidimutans]|uniref:Parallel beta helix pectate lyase-like protein n=1 Tax=Anseongella ginsenosidimutans TaxID=496056 RepID=A0A4R3KL90_9SPHI|nr:hypothetical protein [Anseongella ginsenosidimutans]QEC52145.1 hypothetical protein FRZ59_07210 [Anseongella ginsenosidimutans]TCS84826.1 hypothetical protein EDD80_1174 [Anseongella ginsenosidimutans]